MFPNVPKREKPTQLNAFSVDGQGTFPQGENVPYLPSSDRERQQGTQGTSKEVNPRRVLADLPLLPVPPIRLGRGLLGRLRELIGGRRRNRSTPPT